MSITCNRGSQYSVRAVAAKKFKALVMVLREWCWYYWPKQHYRSMQITETKLTWNFRRFRIDPCGVFLAMYGSSNVHKASLANRQNGEAAETHNTHKNNSVM